MNSACRDLSLAAGEALAGTALKQITRWVLLELPGPWTAKPLESPALSGSLREHLRAVLDGVEGTRLQLIRRGGPQSEGTRLMVARSGIDHGWIHTFVLDDLEALPSVDIAAAWAAPPVQHSPPVILICTHGQRDTCCARAGAPVFHALSTTRPTQVWQTTHLGGHRFAATAVVLPWGVQLGRLEPDEADGLWSALDAGQVHSLDRYRGRTDLDCPAQAAAIFLRRTEGLMDVDAIHHTESLVLPGGGTEERFRLSGVEAWVQVSVEELDAARPTSCGAELLKHPMSYQCRRVGP